MSMCRRKIMDFVFTKAMLIITVAVSALFILIFTLLLYRSMPILGSYPLKELLFSSVWNPERGSFGFYPVIIGTVFVTMTAMLIAIPISVLSAIYISEYSTTRTKAVLLPFMDVLAGVPSVVYGLCAFIILVPLVKDRIAPFFGVESTGFCVLTASIILAVMVFPIIISLCIEAFRAVPVELREASLSLGATRWETVKSVLLRRSAPSIVSACLLGFGRAFGETIAVNMVVGGISRVPKSLFHPSQTLASLIASAYGEMMSIPLYGSALMMVALILFVSVLVFNLAGRYISKRASMRYSQ